jgi:hypothetical protein
MRRGAIPTSARCSAAVNDGAVAGLLPPPPRPPGVGCALEVGQG